MGKIDIKSVGMVQYYGYIAKLTTECDLEHEQCE